MLALLAALLLAGLLVLVVYRLRRRRMYELAEAVCSVKQMPLVGHLHRLKGNTEEIMTSLKQFSYAAMRTNGISAIWIGHLLYFIMVEPVDIEYVLKTCLEKDDLHRFLRKIIGNGIVFAPVSIWRRRRKVMVPTFSPRIVESFVEVFSEQSEELARQLQTKVGAGVFDAWPFFSSYTLDSVCETVMGVQIKAQSNSGGPFLTSMNQVLNLACERIFHLWLQPDWIYKFFPSYKKHQHYLGILHSFADNVIKTKILELNEDNKSAQADQEYGLNVMKRRTFLSLLIAQSQKEQGYSELELREEVMSLMIAGTDTSAVGTCFTLLLLGSHQNIQEKVYQELLDVYGNSERPLVKEDLSKLSYMERVIKESLRLYPPVPFIIRKVDKEITLPSGTVLPAGCGIPVSIWGTHRNPKYWGADAEKFDPDRFAPDRYGEMHPCAFIPFSGSPRNCLGYQYAMMSMKASLAAVLRRYRVRSDVDGDHRSDQIRVKIDVMMKAAEGYNIRVEPREKLFK